MGIHELLEKDGITNQWIKLDNCKSGEILFSAHFVSKDRGGKEDSEETIQNIDKKGTVSKNISSDSTIESTQSEKTIVWLTEGRLDIIVHDARNIDKRESEAMPDTFVLVSLGEQQSKTKLVKGSTNPAYDFKTTINVNKSSPPYLNFEIFDYLNIAKDESLGTLKLNIQDIFVRQPIVNQWIPLENSTPGEIRISISFVDLHNMNSADSQVESKTQLGTHSENNLPTDILALEEENRKLQAHVPEDILANLPPDFRDMLQTEVTKARQALLEEELEKHKKENINPECSGQDTTSTEIEEILDLVKDLDEETSKYIYEQLQIILVEIDQESKSNKIKDLKEELIQLQMEQTKIMPELPKDLLASLPTELSDEIQKSMKEAYLKMATEKMDETF